MLIFVQITNTVVFSQ